MKRLALGLLVWLALVLAALPLDRWVYERVSGPVAERTGTSAWRFERPGGGRSTWLQEALELFRRFGHAFAWIVISAVVVALAPGRWRQVAFLWACIAVSALVGQVLLKPAVSKLRPDAPLDAEEAARARARFGPDAVVVRRGVVRNRGCPLYRGAFAGGPALTFPSGHATLAFAAFTALGLFFPRGRRLFLALAAAAAASRVLSGDHFLSDTLAGAALGHLTTLTLRRTVPGTVVRRSGANGVGTSTSDGAARG